MGSGLDTWSCMCAQGLFERHKLIVATQLAMVVLRKAGELPAAKFDFLLRCPRHPGIPNPIVEWLPDPVWASLQALKVSFLQFELLYTHRVAIVSEPSCVNAV